MARYPRDVFPNGALQGILNTWGAYLAKTSSFWMHGSDILPRNGVFPVQGSLGNTSGRYFARNVAFLLPGVCFEDALFKGCAFICPKWASKKFRPGMHPFAIRKCTSKMLRLGPFGCAGERGDDYCCVQPTSVCPFGVVGLWAMLCCGVSGVGVAVDTNGGGAGGA